MDMNLVPVGFCEVKFSKDDEAVLVAIPSVHVWQWPCGILNAGQGDGSMCSCPKLRDTDEPLGKYGETAIPCLISGLLDMGCKKENLRAWIAGGANVIPSLVSPWGT